MKRMTVFALAAALLLTGCGQITEETSTTQTAPAPTEPPAALAVTGIIAQETGGEDGRYLEWSVVEWEGYYTVKLCDDRMGQTTVYHISEEDYQAIVSTDFTDYIGKSEEIEEGLCDFVCYHTQIAYEDGTICTSDVQIPALWEQLYAVTDNYEPTSIEHPFNDDDNAPSEAAGSFTYNIINGTGGVTECGYYLIEETDPDAPLSVCISMGECSTGGYSISVEDVQTDGDTVIITVSTVVPGPTDVVTEAFTYPGCRVEISPKPADVIVQTVSGQRYDLIQPPAATEDIGELYYQEVSPEDILYDEAHNVYYAKNQLLISADPGTDMPTIHKIQQIAEELDAEVVGVIELTGDYQIKFRHDMTLPELEEVADQLNSYPFVYNVTLNLIEDVTTAE